MRRSLALVLILSAVPAVAGPACLDLDGGKLSPKLRWLQKERLRGALMHRAIVDGFPARALRGPGRAPKPSAPVALRGQHVLLITPAPGKALAVLLRALDGRPEFNRSVFALYAPSGAVVEMGTIAPRESARVAVRKPEPGRYVLLLNPGVAMANAAEVCVAGGAWAIDGSGRAAYHARGETDAGTPLQYHILRDMKLAGMNTLMLDFRHIPFSSDAGLKDWVRRMGAWAEFAGRCGMRLIPAVDLGGSPEEVEGWGDSAPGLYIDPKGDIPVAPCPLQKPYWERILLRRGREVARASLRLPAVVGYGIDPEMYSCWTYGHYMLSGTCFCDHCIGGFVRGRGLPEDALRLPTAKERWEWVRAQKLEREWDAYLEDETRRIAAWVRADLQAINPDLFFVVYVLDINNWFCRGLARGLGTERVPVVNFAESTYWSGYTPGVERQMETFRSWGAHVLHGGGLYPGSHPPTKPGYLGSTAYRFSLSTGGYWLWPMDYFLTDWESRHAYEGQPAPHVDYWLSLRQVGAAIDARLKRGHGSTCAFDELAPHPVWNPEAKEKPEGVEWRTEPAFPLRMAGPGGLYFGVTPRARRFTVTVQAPGAGNGAQVALLGPDGRARGRVGGDLDAPQTIEVDEDAISPGAWELSVAADGGLAPRDVRIRVEGLQPAFTATAGQVLLPVEKTSSLAGWWKLDEGSGETSADASGPPASTATLAGAGWVEGHSGRGLSVGSGGAIIPHGYATDSLSEFTVMAWVKLDALPAPGKGGTIVNKGPEAPVQHFWLWIGYPPDHSLLLEMGNEKHAYGFAFHSGPLAWETGRWYHLAAAFTCRKGVSSARLYRDGALVGEGTREDTFDSGSSDVRLGAYEPGMHALAGAIDEVKLYDRALPEEEIRREAGGR